MNNIIMIGAHFDDVELGAGGTAAMLAAEGKNVYKLTLTNNVTKFTERNITVDYKSSCEESNKACSILGIKEIEFEPIECNHLFYDTEVMQRVERILYEYDIDTMFLHFSSDMNQDHVEASRICLTAARHCNNILMYKSNGYQDIKDYLPNMYFDITDFFEKKKQALRCYGHEHDRYGKLFETVCKRNEIWGYQVETGAAEAFHVIKYKY